MVAYSGFCGVARAWRHRLVVQWPDVPTLGCSVSNRWINNGTSPRPASPREAETTLAVTARMAPSYPDVSSRPGAGLLRRQMLRLDRHP
jgi:hypothetical protein